MNTLSELLTISNPTELITIDAYIWSIAAALFMGVLYSLAMQYKSLMSKSFAVTLAVLPPVVCVVIIMVNGSIGAGIAVAGTFSLVRFRSVPGSAREIVAVFFSMAIGLACSMGNLLYAFIFTVLVTAAFLVLEYTRFGESKSMSSRKVLRITIPEDLDYRGVFEDIFEVHTKSHKLTSVRTTNLGSMFRLSYDIELKDPSGEKELLDQLRIRNGNLDISCSLMSTASSEL